MLNNENLAEKFVKKWFWLYLFTFLIWPLGYVIKVVISGDLSVTEVWLIYGVISLVALLWTYNDLGCTESLNFFLPKYIIQNEFAKAKYILKLTLFSQAITSLLIASIIWIWAPWIAETHFKNPLVTDILYISGLFFIGINILQITTAIFSVVQNTKLQKWMEFVRILFTAIGSSLLLFFWAWTMISYMWIWVGWVFFSMIFSVYLAYTYYYKPYFSDVTAAIPKAERNYFITYAWATLFTTNIAIMLSQVDMQLLFLLLDWSIAAEQAGYYGNYLSILSIPFVLIGPIIHFIFPVISELYWRWDKEKISIIHSQFSLYFSIIAIWVSVFLYQFGEEMSILLFTEKFRESWNILKYSAFFILFNLLIQINFQVLSWTWKIKERAKILLVILPLNIILNILFIRYLASLWEWYLAVYGSALAVWLSWIPLWYMTHRATREYHGKWNIMSLVKNSILAWITYFIASYTLETFHILNNFFILSFAVLLNLIIFFIGNKSMIFEMYEIIKKNRH